MHVVQAVNGCRLDHVFVGIRGSLLHNSVCFVQLWFDLNTLMPKDKVKDFRFVLARSLLFVKVLLFVLRCSLTVPLLQ